MKTASLCPGPVSPQRLTGGRSGLSRLACLATGAVAVLLAVAGCGDADRQAQAGGQPLTANQAAVTPSATHLATGRPATTRPTVTRPATTSPATARRPAAARLLLGVFEFGAEASYQRVETFACTVGRQPDIVLSFAVWGAPFNVGFADIAHAHGSTLLIQLEPTHASLASIVAGRQDRYLRSYATEVRRFGHRVILSFAPEPNGSWYPWGWTRSAPATWRAAWRHVVTLFRKRGASNVTWLWSVDRNFTGSGPLAYYWPGARYVDWVGIDAYYIHRSDTFETVFAPTISDIRRFTNKPILIPETAAGPIAGRARAIPDLFAGSIRHHLVGLVWFDMTQHRNIYHQDWRLEGHPAAIAAFRRALSRLSP